MLNERPTPNPVRYPLPAGARRVTGAAAAILSLPTNLTLPELVDRFLQSCRQVSPRSGRRLSPRTLESYEMCLDGLLYFADGHDWPPPAQLTRQHLRDFMDYLTTAAVRWDGDGRRATSRQAAPATVHQYLKRAKTFFGWCEDEEYLSESPARRFRMPNPAYREIEPYDYDELRAMFTALDYEIKYGSQYLGIRNKAIISTFIDTGLRLTELTGMKLSALDPQLRQVRVLGKGAKYRTVPINGEARKILRLYLERFRPPGGDAVWLTEDGEILAPRSVQIMIKRLHYQAGVKTGGGAHRFRHYYATRYLENGGDINSLRVLLGHATLAMVLKYTKYFEARQDIARAKEFSPLDSLLQGDRDRDRPAEVWGWRAPAARPDPGWPNAPRMMR
jgi:site-specific recombinase XerD